MDYSEKEIFTIFKDKTCLYREGGRISQVLVKNIKVDDWGVSFELEICSRIHANNDLGDLEYKEKAEELNNIFTFSGAWELTSINNKRLHVAYVNGELNANSKSVHLFNDGETDFFKLWNRE